MAIVISSITILFQPVQLIDYVLKNFDINANMKITAAKFDKSTSKKKSVSVLGLLNDKKVHFSLFNEDMGQLTKYINELNFPVWEMEEKFNYDSMENLNLIVPVISFHHSKGVLLVPLGDSPQNTITSWALSNLYMLLLAFLPLFVLSFLNKLFKK